MTTITLEVPDELAPKLISMRDRLPKLLAMALEFFPPEMPLPTLTSQKIYPAFAEMIDFLASRPTPAQIVTFKVSQPAQTRLEELLDKTREEELTENEAAELDSYQQINFVMIMLKAKARPMLSSN